jgi:hypothetical protein
MSFEEDEVMAFGTVNLKAEPSLLGSGTLETGTVEFKVCACGVKSTKVPCWDCFQGKENQRAIDKDKAALPALFRDITDATAKVRVPAFTKWEALLARQKHTPSRSFTFIETLPVHAKLPRVAMMISIGAMLTSAICFGQLIESKK